jgi:hypothetical protein
LRRAKGVSGHRRCSVATNDVITVENKDKEKWEITQQDTKVTGELKRARVTIKYHDRGKRRGQDAGKGKGENGIRD